MDPLKIRLYKEGRLPEYLKQKEQYLRAKPHRLDTAGEPLVDMDDMAYFGVSACFVICAQASSHLARRHSASLASSTLVHQTLGLPTQPALLAKAYAVSNSFL